MKPVDHDDGVLKASYVAKNAFVRAGSVFYSDLNRAVYVADAYGRKIFR